MFEGLDELVRAQLVVVEGERYHLAQRAITEALLRNLRPARRKQLHIGDYLLAAGDAEPIHTV